jgi:hypothetical protein
MTTTLRLVGSLHHGGALYLRLERAGLTIVRHDPGAHEYEVDGDLNVVQHVIAHWDLEGRIERI